MPLADREPVRSRMWAASVGSVGVAAAASLLAGSPWRVVATAALTAMGPLLFGTELARQRAWSEQSVWDATVAARTDEAGSNVSWTPPGPVA